MSLIRSFAQRLLLGRNSHELGKFSRNFSLTGQRQNTENEVENNSTEEQKVEEEFDPSLFRNEVHLIGRVALDPKPLYLADKTLVGYTFLLNVSHHNYRPIYCNVTSFEQDVYEDIVKNVYKNLTVDVKGFFRKSVKVSENDEGERDIRRYFSIGPRAVTVLGNADEDFETES